MELAFKKTSSSLGFITQAHPGGVLMTRRLIVLILILLVTACETPTPQPDTYDIEYNFVGFVGQKPHQQSYYLSAQVVPGDKFYEKQRAQDYLFLLYNQVRATCPSNSHGWGSDLAWVLGDGEINAACWDLLRSETGMRPATRISDMLLAQLTELEADMKDIESYSRKKVLVTDQGQVLGIIDNAPVNWEASCAEAILSWTGYGGGKIIAIDLNARLDDDSVYKHIAEEGASVLLRDSERIPNFCYGSALYETSRPDWVQFWQIEPNEYNLTITDSNGREIEAKFTVGEDSQILVEAANRVYKVGPTNPIMLWTRGETISNYVYVVFSPSGEMMWFRSFDDEGFQGPGAVTISPEVDGVIPFVSRESDPGPYYLLDKDEIIDQPDLPEQQG